MFAFAFSIIGGNTGAQSDVYEVVAYCIGLPSLLLHYYAAFGYIPLARNALKLHRDSLG